MGYPAILSLEAADTTAGLRPGPDTTDLLLSIKSSARRIKFLRLCSSASGRFHRHERLPEATETTAGLRPGPDTTALLLSIKSSARRIKFVCLCSSASGRFHRHERLPEAVNKTIGAGVRSFLATWSKSVVSERVSGFSGPQSCPAQRVAGRRPTTDRPCRDC